MIHRVLLFQVPGTMLSFRRFAAVALFLAVSSVLHAQQRPSGEEARRLLETRPELVAQLRQMVGNSGLTPDQIQARLRAAGYPEHLLDDYIGRAGSRGEGSGGVIPTDDVIDAVASLGIVDSVDTSNLQEMLRRRRATSASRDAARLADADSAAASDTIDATGAFAAFDSLGATESVDPLGRSTRPPVRAYARYPARRLARADSGLTIFGLSVFAGATTQFDPNLAGPVDENYRFGPGDRIVLLITGDAERAHTLDVTREGFIVIPGVGEVQVQNLTLAQLEDVLYRRLGRVYSGLRRGSGATTHLSVNVARLRTNQVFVLGDVEQPGSYRVSGAGTALTALYAAGGPSEGGSMRRIEIRRGGRLVDTLDLYDYLLRADGSHDPRLATGDVVFVPVHGARVRVYGEVVRPATYELKRGETLADALHSAGGFTAEAARRRVQVSRILPPGQRDTTDKARVVIDIASDQFASGSGPAYPLEPGDVIRVFAVSDRVGRRVMVSGDVWTPGAIGFTPGMRLSDALRLTGGIKPDAYLGQVLVSRLRAADSARVQLRTSLQDSTGRPTDDLPLREDDEIRVFSVTEFRPAPYVAITGAVRRGGRFAFREGMTLRDLVLTAGGLDQRAYLKEAEIARLPKSREGGQLAVSTRVPMDSSYLVVRDRSGRYVGPPVAVATPAGTAPDVVLEPYDNVLILEQPGWEKPRQVFVGGEVRFPGTFSLLTRGDRLSDVVARAGGLTASADARGIGFYRRHDRVGRVGIDLSRVMRDPAYRENLLLEDGDSITVPRVSAIVDVRGAVNAPRGVAYRPGADLNYYVRAAGGRSRAAEASAAYVTQTDGNVESVVIRRFLPDGVPEPLAGSVVFVPDRDAAARFDPVQRLALVAQILGSLVAMVAILRR